MEKDFEFQLSCYLDGDLDAAAQAEVENRLRRDPAAQALYQQYQALDRIARTAGQAPPALQWNRLAQHLSDAVAHANEPVVAYRRPWLWQTTRFALAASVLVAAGLAGLEIRHAARPLPVAHAPVPQTQPSSVLVQVIGPQTGTLVSPGSTEVIVGPHAVPAQPHVVYDPRPGAGTFVANVNPTTEPSQTR